MKEIAKTEAELRDAKVPWPKTVEELTEYINSLVDRRHDYGTCVYAVSMAALATFYYVSHKLGATGFQASCADLDFLKRSRSYKHGFMVLDYNNLLYPQYLDEERFPSWQDLTKKNAKWLKEEAGKLLTKSPDAHPEVLAHWKRLKNMRVHK